MTNLVFFLFFFQSNKQSIQFDLVLFFDDDLNIYFNFDTIFITIKTLRFCLARELTIVHFVPMYDHYAWLEQRKSKIRERERERDLFIISNDNDVDGTIKKWSIHLFTIITLYVNDPHIFFFFCFPFLILIHILNPVI